MHVSACLCAARVGLMHIGVFILHAVCVSLSACISACTCLCAARVGLMHIGVFILLLLSGERNFGVRLNKPYSVRFPMDIPVFTGSHADFLIIVRFNVVVTYYALTLGGILELRDPSVCLSRDAAA